MGSMETNVSIVKAGVPTPVSIGVRLREERERLGLNQEAFAKRTPAKTRQSQSNYEKGARAPDALYLAAAALIGADVLYVVTGERKSVAPGAFRPDVLREVIVGVEEAQRASKLRLSPAKKAELVTLLYEQFSGGGKVERPTVERYLRLVS